MANIRVDVDYTIKDGTEIKFRSPVDCSAITGLIVYYPGADGNTVSKVFTLADAHGNNVGDIDHLFAEDVVVKVILDVTKGMAFVQNADTNAYLEQKFVDVTLYATDPNNDGNIVLQYGGTVTPGGGGTGGNVVFTGYVKTVNGIAPDKNGNVVVAGGTVATVEPAEDDIPKVFFGGALQQTKDEAVVPFRYISKTDDFSGYAEIKAQGNSSMNYPKKNQTVKMFADEACESKMKKDFKGWGKQNKHVYKANWIDLSHARNIVSARLWADVVKSRANLAELPELLRTSPNYGAVDGFPVKVYAAGVYQGRYTLNIPKDKWTFNMDDKLDSHCVLCGENYASGCFRASAQINESDWTDEIHDIVPASIKTRWNEVISFVMNSTDEEFKANLSDYFYVDSLVDYYLFGLASCGLDAFGKNQIYMTYDGRKWIASMYDMDSTWGLYWNGSKFVATDYARTSYEDYVHTDGNLLYNRLEQLFYAELQARWAELKNGALSIENIINRFERFTDIAPAELVKDDYASTTGGGKFTGIPSQSTNNIQQIRTFALARQAWTDEYVAGLTPVLPVPCGGIVLDKNTITFETEGSQKLTATVTPDGCTDPVFWDSDNDAVASVMNGVVTAIGNGEATITARCGNYSASCTVVVTGIADVNIPIDYTLDAMADAIWLEGYAVNTETGEVEAKAVHYITEPLTLQNCMYQFEKGNTANSYTNITIYDANDNYVGHFEPGNGLGKILGNSAYKYRIQIYSPAAKHRDATLVPVDNSEGAEYNSIDLTAVTWGTSVSSACATLTAEQMETIRGADQCSAFVLLYEGTVSVNTKKVATIPNVFMAVQDGNAYTLYAPYFTTGTSASEYFAENRTIIQFNKRHS